MNFYMAPLEGISGYNFRNAIHTYFGTGIDKYFTPFIEPHLQKKNLKTRELNDILPEHNQGLYLVPQVMTNSAEAFLYLEAELRPYGYHELNINLGCPSPTVVTKARGAGLLQYANRLDEMLAEIYEKTDCEISIKTRIGYSDPDEWPLLLDIYNKYPLKELIIHTRVRDELYNGTPHYDAFTYALTHSQHKLCYNGDINSIEDYEALLDFINTHASGHQADAVMAGRGMLTDPKLLQKLAAYNVDGTHLAPLKKEEIKAFSDHLIRVYSETLFGETTVLHKMKELWTWLIRLFPDREKLLKKIVKAKTLTAFNEAVDNALRVYPY